MFQISRRESQTAKNAHVGAHIIQKWRHALAYICTLSFVRHQNHRIPAPKKYLSTQNIPQHPKNISAAKTHLSNHTQKWWLRLKDIPLVGMQSCTSQQPWPCSLAWCSLLLALPTSLATCLDPRARSSYSRWIRWQNFLLKSQVINLQGDGGTAGNPKLLKIRGSSSPSWSCWRLPLLVIWGGHSVHPIYLLIQNAINGASLRWPIDF